MIVIFISYTCLVTRCTSSLIYIVSNSSLSVTLHSVLLLNVICSL
nr:MAG TPA: hypothetical protein [Caudoviricetes sp.]